MGSKEGLEGAEGGSVRKLKVSRECEEDGRERVNVCECLDFRKASRSPSYLKGGEGGSDSIHIIQA